MGSGAIAARAIAGLVITAVLAVVLVQFIPPEWYDWIKALHVIAIISWMAAMLYLPRLFIYHTQVRGDQKQGEIFKVMERRLLRAIMNPAMIVAWATGLWLGWQGFSFQPGWLHVKLLAVLALSGLHGYFSRSVRMFAADRFDRSERFWRIVNEVPAVLMVIIVVMVIIKPF